MVPEHREPGGAEARRAEGPVHELEGAGIVPDGVRALDGPPVDALERRVARPVLPGASIGLVVASVAPSATEVPSRARARAGRSRVGLDDAAVQDVDEPACLVELGVVRVVTGDDHELGLLGADRANLLGKHHRQEPFLGPVGRVVGRADLVDELDARRRLFVDELRVRHLGEVDEPCRRAAGATLREIGSELDWLSRPVLEAVVAVPVDDRSAGLRLRLRGCTADGEQEDRQGE